MAGGARGSAEEMWTEPREKGCERAHMMEACLTPGVGVMPGTAKCPGK